MAKIVSKKGSSMFVVIDEEGIAGTFPSLAQAEEEFTKKGELPPTVEYLPAVVISGGGEIK